MSRSRAVLVSSLMLAIGCEPMSSGVPRRPSFGGPEDSSLSGPLRITGHGAAPTTAGWSVVEWPEMTELPVAVEVPVLVYEARPGSPELWEMAITPETPFEARWYGWRWRATPEHEVTFDEDVPNVPVVNGAYLDATPLSDGSYVGRFYGVAYPELMQLLAYDPPDSRLAAWFSMQVFLADGYTLEQAMIVSQGSAVCSPDFGGSEPGRFDRNFAVACDPPLDWSHPLTVEIPGLVSSAGVHVVAPPTEYSFADAPSSGGWRVVDVPRTLIAPPVPAGLCAGVACEP